MEGYGGISDPRSKQVETCQDQTHCSWNKMGRNASLEDVSEYSWRLFELAKGRSNLLSITRFMVNEALISSECLWKIRFNMFKFCFYDVTWSLAEWFYNHITHNNICYRFLQMGSKQKHDHRLSSPGLWLFWREGGSLSGGNTQFLTRSLTALWSFMHLPTFWLHLQTTFETRCMLIIISSERWQSFNMWLWLRVPGFTNLLRVFTSFFVMLFILN
jgi:hypothetical protein